MTKKDYVLSFLESVTGKWPLAKGLKLLVKSEHATQGVIDGMFNLFEKIKKDASVKVKNIKK